LIQQLSLWDATFYSKSLRIVIQTDTRLTKNGLKTTHFRKIANLTKKHREIARNLALIAKQEAEMTEPFKECALEIVSFWARKPMDYDGLACAVAPAIDGIVDAKIIEDDSPKFIKSYQMYFVKVATMKEVRVEVCIRGVQK